VVLKLEQIRMHLNESAFEPSKLVAEYVTKYVNKLNLYNIEELEREFIRKLSDYVKLPRESLTAFPSSTEALIAIMRYIRSRGLKLMTVWPSFHGVVDLARMEGISIGLIQLTPENFELDLVKLSKEGGPNKALYLPNPNNPTSNMLFSDRATLEFLLRKFGLVIVDEAYYEFARYTVADFVKDADNLVIVRTFSKAFSLAGARVGYALASRELTLELQEYTPGFSIATTSLAAALGALEDMEYMEKVVKETIELRDALRERLLSLGLHVLDSKTSFLFIKTPVPGREIAKRLAQRGIRVRSYGFEEIRNYIRVSVSQKENNSVFLEAISDILKTL